MSELSDGTELFSGFMAQRNTACHTRGANLDFNHICLKHCFLFVRCVKEIRYWMY